MRYRRKRNRGLAIAIGPFIVGAALLCLWGNEGRFDYHAAATRARTLGESQQARGPEAIAFSGALEQISFEGEYVTGFENYMVVYRTAQIYCWVKERRDGHDRWKLEWRSNVHSNNRNEGVSQTLRSGVLKPGNYHLGSFEISPAELRFANDKTKLPSSALRLSDRGKELGLRGNNDFFYLKQNIGGGDQLGDERLQYEAIPASETATYFGSVRNGVGQAKVYERKSGMVSKLIKDEGMLHHLVSGNRETALATLKGQIQQLRWMVRIAGTVVSMIGVSIALGSLMHLFMGIPILGRVVRGGVLLGSVLIGGCLSLATIALGWFAHHPLFALLVVGGLIGAGVWLSRRQKVSSANAGRMIQRLETRSAVSGSESGTVSPARAEHVFQHLVQIALVDGKLDKTENAFLADWARARSIPDDRIVTLFDEAKRGKDSDLTQATREDLFYLISLSLADGHLFPKELQRIQRLSRDLGVNDQELESILANIRQGKLEETVS